MKYTKVSQTLDRKDGYRTNSCTRCIQTDFTSTAVAFKYIQISFDISTAVRLLPSPVSTLYY